MLINQIRHALEIAKAGSINKAANTLFISQSALSASIKNLEDKLGRRIFFRTTKGISLTPFGQDFISSAAPICLQIDQLLGAVMRTESRHAHVFSMASSGYYFLSPILASIYEKYRPHGIRIDSYEGSISEIISMVNNQIAEIGIMRRWSCYRSTSTLQLKSLELSFYPIAMLDVGITVGPNNPLFRKDADYVSREELANYPVIMYRYMDEGPYSDIYEKLQIPMSHNKMVSLSRATLYEMLGYTDAYCLNSMYTNNPAEINTQGVPFPMRTLLLQDCNIKSEIGWIKLDNQSLSPIANDVIGMISDYITSKIYL